MQQKVYDDFIKTTNKLIQLISSLSQDKLNQVPFEGSWTAGQVGDHLRRSYGIAEILNGKTITTERPVNEKIKGIKELFLNFDIKMDSPEFIIPSNDVIDKERLIKGLKNKIEQVKTVINNNDDLTRTCLDFELPGSGALTQIEWIQFMTIHTQRHIHQLKNIISKLNITEKVIN
jgi:hypothetical protein